MPEAFGGKMLETLLWRKYAGNAPLDERCQNIWRKGAGNPPLEEGCRKARLGVKRGS